MIPAPDEKSVAVDVFLFLLEKTPPRLRSEQCCRSEKLVDSGTASLPPAAGHMHLQPQDRSVSRVAGRCRRPMWGSDPVAHRGLCSRCWHEWLAFNGPWTTMKANPASHDLGEEGIRRLTFARAGDALPELGSERDWDADLRELAAAANQATRPIDSLELWAELDNYAPGDEPEQWGQAA